MTNIISRYGISLSVLAIATACSGGFPAMALAQDTEDDAASVPLETTTLQPRIEGDKQIYDVVQFARFAPQTARDMVRQIPGFTISQASNDRGLGEATQNVLINGQRISGKSNDAQTVLGRTSVDAVVRIEILDGAGLNIPGLSGQVLNLVTKSTGISGNYQWRVQFRERIDTHYFNGEFNVSGKLGKADFTLGLNNRDSFRGGGFGPEFTYNADGSLRYVRERYGQFSGDRPKLTASYSRTSEAGSIFNANGEFGLNIFRRRVELDRTTPGEADIAELATGGEDERNFELSSDYDFGFAGGRLKLVGYHRFEHSPISSRFRQDFADGTPPTESIFERTGDEGESIARAEYRWKSGKSDWQISAEGAYNFLDVEASLLELDTAGVFQDEPLDNANSRVSEKRGQLILSYGRPLSDKLTLQTQIGGEYSQIRQTGTTGLTRQFIRPKGQVSLAWNASRKLDVSLKLQRKVGQLNFFDFIASVDVQDDNNNAGNPELVPPQSWLAEAELNRSLGPVGSINLIFQYERISDIVDRVPIGTDGEATGNLPGSASRWSAEANMTFLLDTLGWKGAKLDLEGYLQKGRLRDPLTGITRRFGRERKFTWEVNLRHDIPESNWAWGLGSMFRGDAPFFRLDFETLDFRTKPQTFGFIENKDIFGLRVRGQLINLIGQQEGYNQIFYLNRRDGPVDFTREGSNEYGVIGRITVSGTF